MKSLLCSRFGLVGSAQSVVCSRGGEEERRRRGGDGWTFENENPPTRLWWEKKQLNQSELTRYKGRFQDPSKKWYHFSFVGCRALWLIWGAMWTQLDFEGGSKIGYLGTSDWKEIDPKECPKTRLEKNIGVIFAMFRGCVGVVECNDSSKQLE